MISQLCFNHDGTELAASTDNHVVQLWDLRSIRRQLRAMKLDWDLPAYPPVVDEKQHTPPVSVHVELNAALYAVLGARHSEGKEYDDAIASFRRSLDIEPNRAETCNTLAWIYATGPPKLRDPKQALGLIEKAVLREPTNCMCQGLLLGLGRLLTEGLQFLG